MLDLGRPALSDRLTEEVDYGVGVAQRRRWGRAVQWGRPSMDLDLRAQSLGGACRVPREGDHLIAARGQRSDQRVPEVARGSCDCHSHDQLNFLDSGSPDTTI